MAVFRAVVGGKTPRVPEPFLVKPLIFEASSLMVSFLVAADGCPGYTGGVDERRLVFGVDKTGGDIGAVVNIPGGLALRL